MPRLGQYQAFLKSVFFLYDSVDDAKAGKRSGGTGFMVCVPSEVPGQIYPYAVTNWHVACRGTSVVRLNRKDGTPDIRDIPPDHWIFDGGGPDLAITPLVYSAMEHDVTSIRLTIDDLTPDKVDQGPIDVGDDVFMIGRFIDYDGVETNKPALRFGNISIMNAEIEQETGYRGPTIILDMHSRSGFSGSPVFAYRTSGSHFGKAKPGLLTGDEEIFLGHTMLLLGIHCGQFPERWELKTGAVPKREAASLIKTGEYVEGLSGMTTVVPIADLRKLLWNKELVEMRKKNDELIRQSNEVLNGPRPESKGSIAPEDSNPEHREDFKKLLGAAMKAPPKAG